MVELKKARRKMKFDTREFIEPFARMAVPKDFTGLSDGDTLSLKKVIVKKHIHLYEGDELIVSVRRKNLMMPEVE